MGELYYLLTAVYQRMGLLTVASYSLEELQRVTFGEPFFKHVDGFADGGDKGISKYLLLDVLIALNHSGKTALALHITAHSEELCAVGCGRDGRKTKDVFPCGNKLLNDLRRDDLSLAKRELVVLADDAVRHKAGLHVRVVGV